MNRYLCLLVIPLAACAPKKKAQPAQLPEFSVSVGYPELSTAKNFSEWVGQVKSMQKAQILPQVSGYISARNFKNGQAVKQGQILYQIAPQLYEQALQQAEQVVAQNLAKLNNAKKNLGYYAPLVKMGGVSGQTYTTAQQLVKESEAALNAAKAQAQQARTNLGYCTLKSPITGQVGFAQAYVGAYVSPSGKALVEVTLLDPIRINFAVSEQEWLRHGEALSQGKQVNIILADGSSYPYPATIEGVDNRVNTATGTLMLDAHVKNPQGLLRAGMYATVRAQMGEQPNALWVPSSAIAHMQGMNFVLTYPETGKPEMIPVQLGITHGGRVVIKGKGITAKTRIITLGTQQGMMAAVGRCTLRVTSK